MSVRAHLSQFKENQAECVPKVGIYYNYANIIRNSLYPLGQKLVGDLIEIEKFNKWNFHITLVKRMRFMLGLKSVAV